jgi:hypothetical protein
MVDLSTWRSASSLRVNGSRERAPVDAKQSIDAGAAWIASSQGLLAMTAGGALRTMWRQASKDSPIQLAHGRVIPVISSGNEINARTRATYIAINQ